MVWQRGHSLDPSSGRHIAPPAFMNIQCPFCHISRFSVSGLRNIIPFGRFWRKSDGQWIPRFWCKSCQRSFSRATSHPCYRQKKRHKNHLVLKLLAAGTSQREIARSHNLTRRTVVRKLLFLADRAKIENERASHQRKACLEMQFDEMETFEHTKCKPLSIPLLVEAKSRWIYGFDVARMPAKGRLAAISRRKYGPRSDERPAAHQRVLTRARSFVAPDAIFKTDSNPHYPQVVKACLPEVRHVQVKGARGASTGQGELKKIGFDPIFSLNHSCAMLRANVNRLFRRTWCTTKRPDRLRAHIEIYVWRHNQRLLKIEKPTA